MYQEQAGVVMAAQPVRPPAGDTILPGDSTREFVIQEDQSGSYTLKLAYDTSGQPRYYYRNLFTPVCNTGECKPVYINFYWDLLGNYIRYDLPPGEVLTKTDHVEFQQEDYKQLQDILSNPRSLLKDFAIEDLVDSGTDQLSDSVDAITGATPKTIRSEVIGGAVYTCYTLWHIVHGAVRGEIRRITGKLCDDELLSSFLRSDNHHYQYWATDRVTAEGEKLDETFLPEILKLIRGKNLFTARYALEQVPEEVFYRDSLQDWLWETYQAGSYALQTAVIGKLEDIPLSPGLQEALARELTGSNRERFRQLMQILAAQPRLHKKTLRVLAAGLERWKPGRAREVYRLLLDSGGPRDGQTRKNMKKFAHGQEQEDGGTIE